MVLWHIKTYWGLNLCYVIRQYRHEFVPFEDIIRTVSCDYYCNTISLLHRKKFQEYNCRKVIKHFTFTSVDFEITTVKMNSSLFYSKFTSVLYDKTAPCAEFVSFWCKKANTTTYNSGLVMSGSAALNVGAGLVSWKRHLTSRYTRARSLAGRIAYS